MNISIDLTDLNGRHTNDIDTTPDFKLETKSRPSETQNRNGNNKKMRIRVESVDTNNISDVASTEEYMPYYSELKVGNDWWEYKYEPVRKSQAEQQKLSLAQSAKIKAKVPKLHSPHYNESLNLLQQNTVKSLFNIAAKEVCINYCHIY